VKLVAADHEYLAAHWIQKIVDGLKDIYGNTFTDGEYLAFAWQGLRNTDAWASFWANLSNTQRNQINTNLTSGLSKCTKTCL